MFVSGQFEGKYVEKKLQKKKKVNQNKKNKLF